METQGYENIKSWYLWGTIEERLILGIKCVKTSMEEKKKHEKKAEFYEKTIKERLILYKK